AAGFSPPTANLESCWSSFLLSHCGHWGSLEPSTMLSKWWSHLRQMNSKIGMDLASQVKIQVNTIINVRQLPSLCFRAFCASAFSAQQPCSDSSWQLSVA